MIARITLLDCTYLFSLNDYKKNDKAIYNHFKDKYVKKGKPWIRKEMKQEIIF